MIEASCGSNRVRPRIGRAVTLALVLGAFGFTSSSQANPDAPLVPRALARGNALAAPDSLALLDSLALDSLALRDSLAIPDTIELLPEESVGTELDIGRPDTLDFRFEVGGSTDVTNEQFYEDAFVDSVSLGRRLVSTPESRVAGVVLASLTGTRAGRTAHYQLQNELSLGDKLRRDVLGMSWRSQFSPDWRVAVTPRLEYRKDRTFDRDLEEWRGSLGGRLRRAFAEQSTFAEVGVGGDFLRSSGQGSDFLLDRNTAKASVSVERIPLLGPEWRLGYSLAGRDFPDSSERRHLEHGMEGHWRRSFEAGGYVSVDADGARRVTLESAPTSRDRFSQVEGALEGELPASEAVAVRGRAGIEALQYDSEDSTLFFNYQIYRARLTPRLERTNWSLGMGPRLEALSSAHEPGEEYREIAGIAELEYSKRGAWWNVTPAAGWRDYGDAPSSDTLGVAGLHSSYAFAEIGVLADQALPGATRLRLLATTRFEWHIDPAQDARSLYFSLDLRRVF